MLTDHFTQRAQVKPGIGDRILLYIKTLAYRTLGLIRRVVAGIARLAPGAARFLGLPKRRISSLRKWIDEYRASLDWWERGSGPYYEMVEPSFYLQKFIKAQCAVDDQAYLLATLGHYYVHNEVFLAGIPQARVLGPSGVVITPDSSIVEESAWGMGWLEKDRALTSWRLPKPEARAGNFFTIASHSSDCYAHWIFDALPRLSLLERLSVDGLQVIVSGALNRWQQESLAMLGLDHLTFLPLNDRYLELEVLHFPGFVGKPGTIHPSACQWLRRQLLKPDQITQANRRLYITRRCAGRRHVVNEAELEPILSDYGFEIVEAENLSFYDQVQLFSQASAVVGTHGAGLSNLVFAPPECRVLEMLAPTCLRWMFFYLASAMRQEYWYLIGRRAVPASPLHQDSGFDNLYVAPDDFERSLSAMLRH